MIGQLWQPCCVSGCKGEPSCSQCEGCENHCSCDDDSGESDIPGIEERRRIAAEVLRSWDVYDGLTLHCGDSEETQRQNIVGKPSIFYGISTSGLPYAEKSHYDYLGQFKHTTQTVMVHFDQSSRVMGFQHWGSGPDRLITDEERAEFIRLFEMVVAAKHWDAYNIGVRVYGLRLNDDVPYHASWQVNRGELMEASQEAPGLRDEIRAWIYSKNQRQDPTPAPMDAAPTWLEMVAESGSPLKWVGPR